MAAVSPGEKAVVATQSSLLLFLYLFLYLPIFFIIYVSFVDNTVWPFHRSLPGNGISDFG